MLKVKLNYANFSYSFIKLIYSSIKLYKNYYVQCVFNLILLYYFKISYEICWDRCSYNDKKQILIYLYFAKIKFVYCIN